MKPEQSAACQRELSAVPHVRSHWAMLKLEWQHSLTLHPSNLSGA